MGFKINVDRFGFAKKPEPEKVSRDYAAEYAKSLVEKEAKVRNERDIELDNEITAEGDARRTKDEELEEKINQETSLRNAKDAELKKYTEDCVSAEATLRKLGFDSIGRDLEQEAAARANEDATIRGRFNRLTDQERDARIAADDALGKRLDNVYTKDEVDGKIDSIDVDLSGYYTKQDIDYFNQQINNDINDKADMGFVLGNLAGKADAGDVELEFSNINDKIGDIETALDEIISLQVAKGGDAV